MPCKLDFCKETLFLPSSHFNHDITVLATFEATPPEPILGILLRESLKNPVFGIGIHHEIVNVNFRSDRPSTR